MSKTSDLPEWYAAQYLAGVNLAAAEGGAKFKRLTASFPAPDRYGNSTRLSGRFRMSNFMHLKLLYPLGPEGYTCLAMEATAGKATAHYAYAYWRPQSGPGEAPVGEPEYICVSPTFESRDGEYRRRFIRYPVFAAAYERLASELAPFEEAVLDLVARGVLELRTLVYPEESAPQLSQKAADLRLMIVAFAVALALDLWEAEHGILEAHTSTAYQGLMARVSAERPALLEQRPALTSEEFTVFDRGSTDLTSVQCGQKLVPMFTREAMRPGDYNLAAWRELAVARLAADLVLNFVSPAFPLYNQWTYIEGADESLFENSAMEDRYRRARAVEESARSLRAARRTLDAPADTNYHVGELSAQMYESLEYAQSFLLMSPTALLHTMEDVGWPLRSVAAFVRRAPFQWPAAEEAFATLDNAARFLFDVAYAAHCLHTKLGVAHTDLHGNNMTFYMWALADATKGPPEAPTFEPWYEDPAVAYVAGPRGEADTYVFPAAGASGCIIDFSRVILGPGFRPRLEAGRDTQYATLFYRDQVNRVMRTFHRYAPAFVEKNEAALKAAVLANFDAAFPVLCAVDFVAIGRSVVGALVDALAAADEKEVRPFRVARAGIDLAARLEKVAEETLMVGLRDLAESAGSRKQMPAAGASFPGTTILARVFANWAFPAWAARESKRLRTVQLVDAYNFNNELRYAGADYAQYPPWARFDEIERHLGEYKLTDLFERGVEPFLAALRPSARIDLVAERLRAEQERLNGRPAATTSSWLDE